MFVNYTDKSKLLSGGNEGQIKIREHLILSGQNPLSSILLSNYVKSIIFWDMTPCSPLSFNRRFGGT
jgi:hypothetical protein